MNHHKEEFADQKNVDIVELKKIIIEFERNLSILGSPESFDLQSAEFFIELGNGFKSIRKIFGYSQEELGGRFGLGQKRISLLEQGKVRPRLEEACKYQLLILSIGNDPAANSNEKNRDTLSRKFDEACIFLNSDGLKMLEETIDNLKDCSSLKRLP